MSVYTQKLHDINQLVENVINNLNQITSINHIIKNANIIYLIKKNFVKTVGFLKILTVVFYATIVYRKDFTKKINYILLYFLE
jgi:hypothetical protein